MERRSISSANWRRTPSQPTSGRRTVFFANTDGGTILLGVKEEYHKFSVVGVDDARKVLTDFWNAVHGDKVSAVVVYEHDVRIEAVGGKQIVVVEVPRADRADKPVYVGEDVYKGTFKIARGTVSIGEKWYEVAVNAVL